MDPEGRGAVRAMEIAMEKACVGPQNIDYINAHGTSTAVNDLLETLVVKKVMGDYAPKIPMSSTKSMLGHMIAAAGGVEAIICLMTMRDSMIPPTINYEEPDPGCDLDYVPNTARHSNVNIALSNSFGFGGQNICLALRRYNAS
jgi:3-oxoacyl-[acyl-carrier-protein] synthase II